MDMNPLQKWIRTVLESQMTIKEPVFYDNFMKICPERFKPRQPDDIDDFVKSNVDTAYSQSGVVALKRDGHFIEVIISRNTVSYKFMNSVPDFKYLERDLLSLSALRNRMPENLQDVDMTLHGEMFVHIPGQKPETDGGHDLVKTALAWQAKRDTIPIININFFRIYKIGDLYGHQITLYMYQIALLTHLLHDQPHQISVVPTYAFALRSGKVAKVGAPTGLFVDNIPQTLEGLTFPELYTRLLRESDRLAVEGFVITIDHKLTILKPKFNGDYHRAQNQIKCKRIFTGLFFVSGEDLNIYDLSGVITTGIYCKRNGWARSVGKIDDLNKLRYDKSLQDKVVTLRANWISCTDERLTGIKHIKREDIKIGIESGQTLSTMSDVRNKIPHWASVRTQRELYEKRSLDTWKSAYWVEERAHESAGTPGNAGGGPSATHGAGGVSVPPPMSAPRPKPPDVRERVFQPLTQPTARGVPNTQGSTPIRRSVTRPPNQPGAGVAGGVDMEETQADYVEDSQRVYFEGKKRTKPNDEPADDEPDDDKTPPDSPILLPQPKRRYVAPIHDTIDVNSVRAVSTPVSITEAITIDRQNFDDWIGMNPTMIIGNILTELVRQSYLSESERTAMRKQIYAAMNDDFDEFIANLGKIMVKKKSLGACLRELHERVQALELL
jgi:hypothetical protein